MGAGDLSALTEPVHSRGSNSQPDLICKAANLYKGLQERLKNESAFLPESFLMVKLTEQQ